MLNQLRSIMSRDLKVRLEGPAKVSLFVYDNDTFIVESFLDEPVDVKVIFQNTASGKTATDLVSNKKAECEGNGLSLTLQPHTYRVFSF